MEKIELEKVEKKGYQIAEEMESKRAMEEKMQEELKYEKRHQDWTYKILKYNPIDPLNDLYRYIIKRLDLKQIEGRLQWWAAYRSWLNSSRAGIYTSNGPQEPSGTSRQNIRKEICSRNGDQAYS